MKVSGIAFVLLCALSTAPRESWARGGLPFSQGGVRHAEAAERFDSARWLEKRDAMDTEAARLRSAFEKCSAEVESPAANVSIPVENYPDGTIKAGIAAEKAQFFLSEGLIWGEGVVVSQYSEAGVVQAQVSAENCVVDRKSKSGWAEGLATITYGGTSVEGKGVYFSLEEEYVAITGGTKITSTDLKLGGLRL